jgi:hypothetical protein
MRRMRTSPTQTSLPDFSINDIVTLICAKRIDRERLDAISHWIESQQRLDNVTLVLSLMNEFNHECSKLQFCKMVVEKCSSEIKTELCKKLIHYSDTQELMVSSSDG